MTPTIKIASETAGKYLRFGRRFFERIEDERQRLNLPALKRTCPAPEGVMVTAYCSPLINWLLLWGGDLPLGQIMLANQGAQFWVYDYLADTLRLVVEVDPMEDVTLHPFVEGACHAGEALSVKQNPKDSTTAALSPPGLTPVTVDHNYDVEVLTGPGQILQRGVTGDAYATASLPSGAFEWKPEDAAILGPLTYLPRTHDVMWNLCEGPEWWVYTPATRNLIPSSWWVPNIFLAEGGNGVMVTGFYYGAFGTNWRENDVVSGALGNPSTSVKVTFNALMQNLKGGALLPYGYCETLVSMDAKVFNEVFFYLSSGPMPDYGNPSLMNQGATYHRDGGTFMHGKDWSFSILPTIPLPAGYDYEVSFWNTDDDRPELDLSAYTNDYVGAVIALGAEAELWLYTGAQRMLYKTERYHSHSTSTDGRLVAIFEQIGGVIDTIVVFDLLNRAVPNDNTSDYIPEIPLRTSSVVASAQSLSGCFIPSVRTKSAPATALPYDPAAVAPIVTEDDPEQLKLVGSFGWVIYNYLDLDGLAWRKIVCVDGIHAESKVHDDTCMDGNFTVVSASVPVGEEPTGVYTFEIEGEQYTGPWAAVIQSLPYVLWSMPGWPFQAALCKWKVVDGKEVGEPVEVTVSGGDYAVVTGPLAIPVDLGGVTSAVTFDPPTLEQECAAQEVEYLAGTTTYGCGGIVNAYDTVSMAAADPLELTVSNLDLNGFVQAGTQFTGTGGVGVGVYTKNLACGPVCMTSAEGYVTYVDATACGILTVTYTNECGSVSLSVKMPGGKWNLQSTQSYDPVNTYTGGGSCPDADNIWCSCKDAYSDGCSVMTSQIVGTIKYEWDWTIPRTLGGGLSCPPEYCASRSGLLPTNPSCTDYVCVGTKRTYVWGC